jgi:hypothetical protein
LGTQLWPKLGLGINESWHFLTKSLAYINKAKLCQSMGFPSAAWEPEQKSRQSGGYVPFAKLELGVQVRPQAGAWGREKG